MFFGKIGFPIVFYPICLNCFSYFSVCFSRLNHQTIIWLFVFVLTTWWIKCGKLLKVNILFVNVQSVDRNEWVCECVCFLCRRWLVACIQMYLKQSIHGNCGNYSITACVNLNWVKNVFVRLSNWIGAILSVSNSIYSVITNIQHYWVNLLINYFLGFLVV